MLCSSPGTKYSRWHQFSSVTTRGWCWLSCISNQNPNWNWPRPRRRSDRPAGTRPVLLRRLAVRQTARCNRPVFLGHITRTLAFLLWLAAVVDRPLRLRFNRLMINDGLIIPVAWPFFAVDPLYDNSSSSVFVCLFFANCRILNEFDVQHWPGHFISIGNIVHFVSGK